MKLLYFTDTHIRGVPPQNRKDDFHATLHAKFNEIIEIINAKNIDFLLHGGDVFDRPVLSPSVIRDFVRLFKKFGTPIYAIAGNHDIYGHNPATINRTMLGLLDAFGLVQLIDEGEKVCLEKDGIRLQLTGQPFHYDLDRRDSNLDYKVKNEIGAKYCIHMVHGMLVERALPDGVPHTMVDQVWSDDVDILLTGHYHAGFPLQYREGRYIINPGALVRINNHYSEIRRLPQVVFIELGEEIKVEIIPLACAPSGESILDRSSIEEATYQREKLVSFVQQVKSASNFKNVDILDIVDEISSANDIEEEVRAEAKRRIAMEQEVGERL